MRSDRTAAFARRVEVDGHLVAPGALHGSVTTYTNRGCRCEPCTVAKREIGRAERKTRRRRTAENGGVAPVAKHGPNTYANWRCRCETCVSAWNKQAQSWMREWRGDH